MISYSQQFKISLDYNKRMLPNKKVFGILIRENLPTGSLDNRFSWLKNRVIQFYKNMRVNYLF
jgi:hypothetical protein